MRIEMIWICLFWIGYFYIHSFLATNLVKDKVRYHFPKFFMFYRLGYNLIAIVLFIPYAWLEKLIAPENIFTSSNSIQNIFYIFDFLAIAGLVYSSRAYDMKEFLGFSSFTVNKNNQFSVSHFNKYIRHPWYFFSIILIWSRALTDISLVSNILITLYFWLGSELEEQKLILEFGDQYLAYRKRVPRLIPYKLFK